jgi:GT2 family glycosyltransferase
MSTDCAASPAVSVVIPAYNSHATIVQCLEALGGQTFRDFEAIVVDSGPDETTARTVPARFPWVRYVRSGRRLLPHAARNRGVALARGEWLVFTDPDIYASPDWLDRLLAAGRARDAVIVGALACHGRRWLDVGIHLCKFGAWLPDGAGRPTHMSPTANMLMRRQDFDAAGGFSGDGMLDDVAMSRRLRERGRQLWFEPRAVVAHHHLQGLADFMRERYTRGQAYGQLRIGWYEGRWLSLLTLFAATVAPVRLARVTGLAALQAWRAGQITSFVATLPLLFAGHAAALAGEAVAYAQYVAMPGLARVPTR